MNLTSNLNWRLVCVNLLVVMIIFAISYGYLYQLNKIEDNSLNKLAVVNEKQNTLEQLRAEVFQLELGMLALIQAPSETAELKVLQRLKLFSEQIAKAKAAGGIDLLKLEKLSGSVNEFSRNLEKLNAMVGEINKISTEVLAPQFEKANLIITELETRLFHRKNYALAKTVFNIRLLLIEAKQSFLFYNKTIDIVKSNENSSNKRILSNLVTKIQSADLQAQEQSLFFSFQAFVTNYNDTIKTLHKRVMEKEVMQRRMFQLQLKKQYTILDQQLLHLNNSVTTYAAVNKHNLAQAKISVWIAASITIILATLLGWYLRKKLIRPITDLVKLSQLLAASNFKQLLKLTKHSYVDLMASKDQFGDIARACESSAKYQQRMIFDIDTACQGLTLGLLEQNTSFEYAGEYQLVERTLNNSKNNVKALVTDIIDTSEAISLGKLQPSTNASLYLGDFQPIAASFKAITENLQAQLEDIVSVARSMELGLEDKQNFVLPSMDYLGEFRKISESLGHTVGYLSSSGQETLNQDWLKSGLSDMNRQLTGEQPLEILTKNSVDFIAQYFSAPLGYIYRTFEDNKFGKAIKMIAHYGVLMDDETKATRYKFVYPEGVGLIGQVFVTPEIIIKKLSDDERIPIAQSGIATAIINYVVVVPIMHEGKIEGVLELGLYDPLTYIQKEFLLQVMTTLGIAMNVAVSRDKINQLFARSQQQAEELEVQQEKLGKSNEMLHLKAQELEEKQLAVEHKNQQLEQASSVMEEKARELTLASKYKSEFLANMSHELRSPLNSLLILAKLLIDNKNKNLDGTQVKYAEVIYRSGTDLLHLIEDILDLSKIEAGKTDIHYENTPVIDLVEHINQRFSQLANDKQIDFIQDVEAAPHTINVDRQRLLQIITNLLANAFKFTQSGEVAMQIAPAPKGSEFEDSYGKPQKLSDMFLRFRIRDTGIGISAENKSRVFQAFQQADGTTSRKFGGTGLGLAITLQLVELMGGFLQIDSEQDVGSTFSVYLPLRACQVDAETEVKTRVESTETSMLPNNAPVVAREPVQEESVDADASKDSIQHYFETSLVLKDKSVLIVDDNISNVFALSAILEAQQVNCLIANNGLEAIDIIKTNSDIDLILMDIMMPELDGYKTMNVIRDNPQHVRTPIIALTAKAMPEDRNKCIMAGANDYMTKPLDPEKLISLMNMWVVTTPNAAKLCEIN